ncbi:hypothetical protein ACFQ9U_12875 [Streptomyces sp. NPDC056568]|uniref:hypothetical protein n=1 Tax=Streptomyces sp. NPDC056568 TaxID=3345866 RepID=UPI003678679E
MERPRAGAVWKTVIELADRLGAGMLLPDGTFVCREEMRTHLPEGLERGAVFLPGITLASCESAAGPFTHPLT